jgi:hypothetical protein
MSTSNINCPKCKNPVAVKHHSGRIRVVHGVLVVLTSAGVQLSCRCGHVRIVSRED